MPLDITIPDIAALIVGLIGAITDIRTGKIYNVLTFPAALVGIIMLAALGAMDPVSPMAKGIAGAGTAIFGWIVALVIMLLLKVGLRLRETGAGDIKLLAALGTFVGPSMIFAAFIYYCAVFAFWTCTTMALAFPWKQVPMAYVAKNMAVLNLEHFREVCKRPIPMGPFITVGLLIAILLKHPTMKFMGFEH